MIYFPRNDDTRDLKILIQKEAIGSDYINKFSFSNTQRGAFIHKAYKRDDKLGYMTDYEKCNIIFHFDRDHIYGKNDEPISLAQLLLHTFISSDAADDDEVIEILHKRGLEISDMISVSETSAIYSEYGDSYDSDESIEWGSIILDENEKLEDLFK